MTTLIDFDESDIMKRIHNLDTQIKAARKSRRSYDPSVKRKAKSLLVQLYFQRDDLKQRLRYLETL